MAGHSHGANPSGGLYLYFAVPSTCVIGSMSGGQSLLGPGIDTRGPGRTTGGYLVGPESIVAGRRYVIEQTGSARPLPSWLAQLLAKSPSKLARVKAP